MKDYSKMSDFEVNVQVAEQEGINWYCPAGSSPTGGWEYCSVGELMLKDDEQLKDCCNSPSDAWPIMLANGIATIAENGEVIGATNNSQEYYENFGSRVHSARNKEKPLRATMIVYLMMKDEE